MSKTTVKLGPLALTVHQSIPEDLSSLAECLDDAIAANDIEMIVECKKQILWLVNSLGFVAL